MTATQGYRALRESAAWMDLSGRGKIAVRGDDRVRLLHAMATNNIEGLASGGGCYTFFLNAQGRILGDANLFRMPDTLLLDTEPETLVKLREQLAGHVIADDVVLEDATGGIATLAVEGPFAADSMAVIGAPWPSAAWDIAEWGVRRVARVDSTGAGGCFVFTPVGEEQELIRRLGEAGVVEAAAADARLVRLEHGKPRYGEDFTEDYVPHETQLLHAVHFNKGCYLGQEIVQRIRSRGHVNRLLARLLIDAEVAPEPGAPLPGGAITSAAFSPALGKVVALGYVRAELARPGTGLVVNSASASVLPPFVPHT
jgi:aminomethyltransferase